MTTYVAQAWTREQLLTDALVGRTADGTRVYVSATIQKLDGGRPEATQDWQTVEHETVSHLTRISLSGLTVDKGYRNAAGQCLDILDDVTEPAAPFTLGDVRTLASIWRRWHLNDMCSHCAHQDRSIPWDQCPPCPVTGYRAGSAWLVEPLPEDRPGQGPADVLRFIAGRTPKPQTYAGN